MLENDLTWRTDELRFYKNQLENISVEAQKDIYRKSLILILYSHYEGFTKIGLGLYVQYINSLHLKISDLNTSLKAAALNNVFEAYDKIDAKSQYFKKSLPDDKVLHRSARRIEFLDKIRHFDEMEAVIPDKIIDTKSNLSYAILQKNLFQIGLSIDSLKSYEGHISGLLQRRNSIAHGDSKYRGIPFNDYSYLETTHIDLMNKILQEVYNSATNRRYLI